MTGQEAYPAISLSPYLSLRQAVQPAIYVHRLLAADAELAGALAAECDDLLALTRELLKASGQVHIIAGESAAELPAEPENPRRSALLDAYADAGMMWAKVVGCSMVLASALLERGAWDEVRRLAAFLHGAGEVAAAAGLRAQLGKAIWDRYQPGLRQISSRMSAQGTRQAISILRATLLQVPEEFAERDREINLLLVPLACSIRAIVKELGGELPYDSRVEHIATGGVAKYPEIVMVSLDELSAEFEGAVG